MDEYGLGKVTREEARFQMVSVPAGVVLSTCSRYSSHTSLKVYPYHYPVDAFLANAVVREGMNEGRVKVDIDLGFK